MQQENDKESKKHLAAYLTSSLLCGFIVSVLGPLIPYLAEHSKHEQTEFGIMFLCRASGVIIAALTIKIISRGMHFHDIIIFSSFLICISTSVFSLQNSLLIKNLSMLMIGISTGFIQISINMGLMTVTKPSNIAFWLQLLSGMWSVGNIIGPFFVYFFEQRCYMVIGLGFLLLSPFYYCLDSPQIQTNNELIDNREQNVSQLKELPQYLQIRMGFLVFAFIGSIGGFFGWIFSYVVIRNLFTKQRATNLNAIFYICATVFKFLLIFYKQKSSVKLKLCATGALLALIFGTICCIFKIYMYGVLIASVSLGLFCANLYAYTISLPAQFNFSISTSQRANFSIIQSLGEVCMAPLIGLLMHSITPDMLFYSVLFIMLAYYLVTINTLDQFNKTLDKQYEVKYEDQQLQ